MSRSRSSERSAAMSMSISALLFLVALQLDLDPTAHHIGHRHRQLGPIIALQHDLRLISGDDSADLARPVPKCDADEPAHSPPEMPNLGQRARGARAGDLEGLSLIHISEPTRLRRTSYGVFC